MYFFYVYLFLREGERETECELGRGRERGRQNLKQAPGSQLPAVSTEPEVGLEPMNCEIMTWAEVRGSTDWATQLLLNSFPEALDLNKDFCSHLFSNKCCHLLGTYPQSVTQPHRMSPEDFYTLPTITAKGSTTCSLTVCFCVRADWTPSDASHPPLTQGDRLRDPPTEIPASTRSYMI